jgi:ABC-type multidrug transport system ATPase subunit
MLVVEDLVKQFGDLVAVDPQSRERLFEMVRQERDKGTCVVYTTH